MNMQPENPTVPKGKFALYKTEIQTGIVITLEGRWLQEKAEWFIIFDSLEQAKRQADALVIENPKIECIVQDDQNRQVARVRNETYVQAFVEQARKARQRRRKWWKFW